MKEKSKKLKKYLKSCLQIASNHPLRIIESALSLVRRGIGATILPSYVYQYGSGEQNKIIRFLPLPTEQYPQWEKAYRRQVCLFYRKEQFLTEAERQFIACVRREVQNKN